VVLVDRELGGIVESEIEQLLVAEGVQLFVESVAQVGGYLYMLFNYRALGIVVLILGIIFVDFDKSASRRNGYVGDCDLRSAGKCGSGFLASSRTRRIHLGVLEFADQILHLRAIARMALV